MFMYNNEKKFKDGTVSFNNYWDKMSEEAMNFEDDRVNSPSHYTAGTQEAIDIIEEAIANAPTNKAALLQGQVLKYLLRVWLKDNPLEDLKKSRWYLERLINTLE